MNDFCPRTHAAIPGRGTHSALYQLRGFLLHYPEDTKYCLKLDIRQFFPSIDRKIMISFIESMTKDKRTIELNREIILSHPKGLPIGNYTSQYYANKYLSSLDQWLYSHNVLFVRYMDDIVILAPTKDRLHKLLPQMIEYLKSNLSLDIKPNYQIFPVGDRGIDFVGYRIWPNRVIVRKSTFNNMRKKFSKIYNRICEHGHMTPHDRSTIAAYLGIVIHCTPKARATILSKYFSQFSAYLPNICD